MHFVFGYVCSISNSDYAYIHTYIHTYIYCGYNNIMYISIYALTTHGAIWYVLDKTNVLS